MNGFSPQYYCFVRDSNQETRKYKYDSNSQEDKWIITAVAPAAFSAYGLRSREVVASHSYNLNKPAKRCFGFNVSFNPYLGWWWW